MSDCRGVAILHPVAFFIEAELGLEVKEVLLEDPIEIHFLSEDLATPAIGDAEPTKGGGDYETTTRPAEPIAPVYLGAEVAVDHLLKGLPGAQKLSQMT